LTFKIKLFKINPVVKRVKIRRKEMAELNITLENFESEVLKSDKPVLVDFWASWCGPCRMLLPIIEEIASEEHDFKVGKINADEQPELVNQFKVRTIPTLMVFKNGEVVNKHTGVLPKEEVIRLVNE
jgi:thioredoxin